MDQMAVKLKTNVDKKRFMKKNRYGGQKRCRHFWSLTEREVIHRNKKTMIA